LFTGRSLSHRDTLENGLSDLVAVHHASQIEAFMIIPPRPGDAWLLRLFAGEPGHRRMSQNGRHGYPFVLEPTFYFRIVEMRRNVWQISSEMAGIYDKNLTTIATQVVSWIEHCHIPNHNLFVTNLYPSEVLPEV
jgi:hypothetical protein